MSAEDRDEVGPQGLVSLGVLRHQLATLSVPTRTAAILAGLPPGPGTLDAGCAGAGLVFQRLVEAIVDGEADPRVYEGAVAALSGLGPGLTPTGDDLLVALLVAGRHFAGSGLMFEGAHAQLARAVATSPPGRTTPTAQHWLGEACEGRAPTPLARFVEVLGNPEIGDDELAKRCGHLVSTGAHSGADWLAAVLALAHRCSDPPAPPLGCAQLLQDSTPDPNPDAWIPDPGPRATDHGPRLPGASRD